MKDTDIVHFYKSEEIFEKAQEIFSKEKVFLESILPKVDIEHVGSCSVQGAISKFDIDIQIRVTQEQFSGILEIMQKYYEQKYPERWNQQFAILKKPNEEMDLILTVIDSRCDDYWKTRDYLRAHPEVLAQYNELKLKYEGKPYAEYRKAKQEFMGLPGNVKFLEYK